VYNVCTVGLNAYMLYEVSQRTVAGHWVGRSIAGRTLVLGAVFSMLFSLSGQFLYVTYHEELGLCTPLNTDYTNKNALRVRQRLCV
jgi:hypothetical protein